MSTRNNFLLLSTTAILLLAFLPVINAPTAAAQEFAPKDLAAPIKLKITASDSESGDVRWMLPGPRQLDPEVFGTPERPLGTEPPLIGVPVPGRLTTEDGSAFTTTKDPTPFGDKAEIITGSLEMTLEDRTLVDNRQSKDTVDFRAAFTSPSGKEYVVTVTKPIPVGPDHPFFGGVATNFIHHGGTGIGPRLVPAVYTYAAFWGVGVLTIDGVEIENNRLVHVMVTGNLRDEQYKMALTTSEVNEEEVLVHVMVLPRAITPEGPTPSPVPTQFILPNDVEQPFLHINYHNVELVDLTAKELQDTKHELASTQQQLTSAQSQTSNLQQQLQSANDEVARLEGEVASSLSSLLAVALLIGAVVVVGLAGFFAGRRGRKG